MFGFGLRLDNFVWLKLKEEEEEEVKKKSRLTPRHCRYMYKIGRVMSCFENYNIDFIEGLIWKLMDALIDVIFVIFLMKFMLFFFSFSHFVVIK